MLERGVTQIIDDALEKNVFGESFLFREGQREVVEAICNHYLEAPEGQMTRDMRPESLQASILGRVPPGPSS